MDSQHSNLTTTQVKELVENALTNAEVQVTDIGGGTSDHFQIDVASPDFAGLSRIEQHKLVHRALGEHLTNAIHAVQINCRTP